MNTQQDLDKWINSCLTYYNTHSITKIEYMKTNEERIQQLEQAHSRLYNLFTNFQKDFEEYKLVQLNKFEELKHLSQQEEQNVPLLPDNLYAGTEYKAVIAGIVKATPTVWKEMNYVNWEIKLEGKPDYVFVAFIKEEYVLQVGDAVTFTYAHPFQCRKLKQI